MSFTSLAKKCWKELPQPVRRVVLGGLCAVFVGRRAPVREDAGPLFVLGAFRSSSGLAQGARLYAEAVRRAGRPVLLVDITAAMLQRQDFPLPDGVLSLEEARTRRGGGTVVLHANPPQFQLTLCRLGREFLRQKRIVGYWAWELQEIPAIWKQALRYVDAVEVPSTFVREAVARHTRAPVTVLPHAVPAPPRVKQDYAADGVVRCLFSFDFSSSFERKNPLAALQAFAQAFPAGRAELTFKVSGADDSQPQFAAFRTACARVAGVRLLTQCLDAAALEALYLRHDIYLSLHRSEGYGLTIREAMRCGLYVVATGWSGNMDFMRGEKTFAVPYTLTPVNLHSGPCKGLRTVWAEADVPAAAALLRQIAATLLPAGPAPHPL